eukprot:414634-Lingulodinium_polyedra.AAC.1
MAWTCSPAYCPMAARRPSMTGPKSAPNCHGPSRFDASTGADSGAIGAGGGGGNAPASVDAG